MGKSDFSIELGSLIFTNESEQTFKFEARFLDDQYNILAIPREISNISDGSAMVSLAVDGSSVARGQVTIKASAKFTGSVDIIAIRIS